MQLEFENGLLLKQILLKNLTNIFTLVCLCLSLYLNGQSGEIQFSYLTEEKGFPDHIVLAILTDSEGYVWFGTDHGLIRWDGSHFTTFLPNPDVPGSISGRTIKDLREDEAGNIWIALVGGGLNKYDRTTESFTQFLHDPKDPKSLPSNLLISLYLDSEGILWMGTFHDGFIEYHPEIDSFAQHNLSDLPMSRDDAFMNNSVHNFVQDLSNPNLIWVAGTNSLYSWNKKTKERVRYPSTLPNSENTSVEALVLDQSGDLWLATYGKGIVRFDTKLKTWNYFPEAGQPDQSVDGIITCIIRKSQHELWYSSLNKGSGIFNCKTGRFEAFQPYVKRKNSILHHESNLVYQDDIGRIWFAHTGNGLSYSSRTESLFGFTEIGPGSCTRTNSYNQIADFGYDPTGRRLFLAGSSCDGVFVLDEKKNLLEPIVLNGFEGEFQVYRSVLFDSRGQLWLGAKSLKSSAGVRMPALTKFNGASGKLEALSHPVLDQYGVQESTITYMMEDSKGRIWIGSDPIGLLLVEGNSIQVFQPKSNRPEQKDFPVNEIRESPNGEIWVAFKDMGLFEWNGQQFEEYQDPEQHFPIANANSFLIDQKKNLWLGHGEGLTRIENFQSKQPVVTNFSKEHLFPGSTVDKLIQDKNGHIWATTFKGLTLYDEASNSFITLDEFDGLQNKLFFRKGFREIASGELLLGQDGSFYSIDPGNLFREQEQSKLVLTQVLASEEPYQAEQSIDHLDAIRLQYSQNFFTIKYALLSFDQPEKNNYQYILEGYDKDWQQVGNRSFANYTKVREGTYTFRVRGTDKKKRSAEKSIQIIVYPPWYRSILAYFLYALSLIGIIYIFYAYQRRRWKLQTQLQLKEQEATKLKELDLAKTRLYANITHEFRTPLTIISGMAGQVREQPQKWLERGTNMIERNSRSLLNLVNQMLNLSKLESGKLQLEFVQGNVIPYLRYIMESFQSYAATKELHLHFIADEEEIIMDYDSEKLLQIISNLLSNAIKFTPANGQIYLQIASVGDPKEPMLEIKVKDTGIGIPPDQLDKLFERFYQVDASSTRAGEGTGIGLTLTKELIELHGGRIKVSSKLDHGSTFKLLLPISNSAVLKSVEEQQRVLEAGEVALAIHPVESEIMTEDGSSKLPPLLIIEDNPDVIQYLIACLEGHYQILEARDGDKGVEMAIKHVPDIIISDVMMPKKDGFEVCDILKQDERTSHIPIILLTAKADAASRLEGLKRGADAYLAKPFDREELFVRLEQLIELRQRLQRRYDNPEWATAEKESVMEPEDAFLLKVRQVVEEHLDDGDFSIHQLCKAVRLSRTQLHQKIKHLTGRSTSIYIRLVRLQKAYQLLKNPRLNISEVAYEVGFKDPNYFTRVFTEEFGAPPTRTR